jgi:hypothetical protein
MPPSKQLPQYEPVDKLEDFDLENDSDTTLASTGFLAKPNGSTNGNKRVVKKKAEQTRQALVWLRWGTIVILQALIVVLLLGGKESLMAGWNGISGDGGWTEDKTETGGDVNGLYIPSELKSNLNWTGNEELTKFEQPLINTNI